MSGEGPGTDLSAILEECRILMMEIALYGEDVCVTLETLLDYRGSPPRSRLLATPTPTNDALIQPDPDVPNTKSAKNVQNQVLKHVQEKIQDNWQKINSEKNV